MTKEEQKKLIEGFVTGLCAGSRYCFDVSEKTREEKDGTIVVPMDSNIHTAFDEDIRSLMASIEEMVKGEGLPYLVDWRLELVLFPNKEQNV